LRTVQYKQHKSSWFTNEDITGYEMRLSALGSIEQDVFCIYNTASLFG